MAEFGTEGKLGNVEMMAQVCRHILASCNQ